MRQYGILDNPVATLALGSVAMIMEVILKGSVSVHETFFKKKKKNSSHASVSSKRENSHAVSARRSALLVHPLLFTFIDQIVRDLGGDYMEPRQAPSLCVYLTS